MQLRSTGRVLDHLPDKRYLRQRHPRAQRRAEQHRLRRLAEPATILVQEQIVHVRHQLGRVDTPVVQPRRPAAASEVLQHLRSLRHVRHIRERLRGVPQ